MIIEGNVPELLRDRRIVVLDLAMMVAGTKYRGQFEERIKAVMNEVRRAPKNTILFIRTSFTHLVGRAACEGAIDASNVLKPAARPRRGPMHRRLPQHSMNTGKYIEKDGALERRFQTIVVRAAQRKGEALEILPRSSRPLRGPPSRPDHR